MTPEQIAEAQKMARDCQKRKFKELRLSGPRQKMYAKSLVRNNGLRKAGAAVRAGHARAEEARFQRAYVGLAGLGLESVVI